MRSTDHVDDVRDSTVSDVAKGQYLHSDRDLYHVEHLGPERALLEDCRTGTLLDVPLGHLHELEPVSRTHDADAPVGIDLSKRAA